MPTAWSLGRQPKYRLHKASGNAVVTLYGRDVYLGKHGSKDSRLAYARLLMEWTANDGVAPPCKCDDLSVAELTAGYKRWAKKRYVREGVSIAGFKKVEMMMNRLATGPYGVTDARQFGPAQLKALQVDLARSGKARSYVNDLIDIVRRCFKWGVSEGLLPPDLVHGLETVPGLRRGEANVRETAPVLPVEDWVVEATLPFLPPVVDDTRLSASTSPTAPPAGTTCSASIIAPAVRRANRRSSMSIKNGSTRSRPSPRTSRRSFAV